MNRPYTEAAMDFDPSPLYRDLLARACPVHVEAGHDPPFAVLSHYDDVIAAVRRPDVWHNDEASGVFVSTGGVLGSADDPDHHRQRSVLRSSFSPPVLARHEAFIRQSCADLLDPFLAAGGGDFVEAFSLPFPAVVIGRMLGVAREDGARFEELAGTIVDALTGGDVERYAAARAELGDHIEARIGERRDTNGRPGDTSERDVIDTLSDGVADGRLSMSEARLLGHQLLVAGHETTASLLSLFLLRLIERPALWAQLRSSPDRLPEAIEEALRFDSPVSGLFARRRRGARCTT